jgi:hypothetical protein
LHRFNVTTRPALVFNTDDLDALFGNGVIRNCKVENNKARYGGAGINVFDGGKLKMNKKFNFTLVFLCDSILFWGGDIIFYSEKYF